jgi:hypothetical protein
MNADEILADPSKGLDLPEGAVLTHIIVIAEYADPTAEEWPGRVRMASVSDDDCPPWTCTGMMRFAEFVQLKAKLADDE